MKRAEDWEYKLMSCQNHQVEFLGIIRAIQADAIRWAANLSGPFHRKAALDKADELDPPPAK